MSFFYLTSTHRNAWCPAVMLPRINAAHQLAPSQAQRPTEGLSPSPAHPHAGPAMQCLAGHGFLKKDKKVEKGEEARRRKKSPQNESKYFCDCAKGSILPSH